MERRPIARGSARKNRRLKTFLWVAGTAILIISLIYFEQTAILYVLATLSVTVLLALVAFADLHGVQRGTPVAELGDDAAAIADGISSGSAATATAVKPPVMRSRRPRSKRK